MSSRYRFRPSETWALEDRLAPSSIGSAHVHEMISQQVPGTVRGHYSTTSMFGVDTESSVAKLTGSGSARGVSAVKVNGSLSNSEIFPSHWGETTGTLVLTAPKKRGTLTLSVVGPYGDLGPTHSSTLNLTFTITKATGSYATKLGDTGSVLVTLKET